MRLYIPDLKKEEGKFLSYRESLRLDLGDDSPLLNINLQAAFIPHRVLIKGEWDVEVKGECSRCLEATTLLLKESFYEEFIQLKASGEVKGRMAGVNLEKEEKFVFKGDTLDLKEYFRQSFLLSQPLKILCHSQCKGLCPVCGINKNKEQCACTDNNIDPRWALLQKLQTKPQK